MSVRALAIAVALTLLVWTDAAAQSRGSVNYKIYFDMDRTAAPHAARSIELGFTAALLDLDGATLKDGRAIKFEFVRYDHRKNIYRSKRHFDAFVADPSALALVAGKESPPLIRYREYLNENEALILAPWSAGAPVTRAQTEDNWIFRLSVDDRKAGAFLAGQAVMNRDCEQIHLVLIDNRWGQGSAKNLKNGLARYGKRASSVVWLPWATDEETAYTMLSRLGMTAQDCLIMVAPARESIAVSRALFRLSKEARPSVLSHWGMTGSNFEYHVPMAMRDALDFRFIQTCHDLFSPRQALSIALERLRKSADGAAWANAEIRAPAGFANAYDLGLIFAKAIQQASLTGVPSEDRRRIRTALHSLNEPVRGLIKTYRKPFQPYDLEHPDAHEALGADDLCIAEFDSRNVIRVDVASNGGDG